MTRFTYTRPGLPAERDAQESGYKDYLFSETVLSDLTIPVPWQTPRLSIFYRQGQLIAQMMHKTYGGVVNWPKTRGDRKLFSVAFSLAIMRLVNGHEPGDEGEDF